MLVASLGVPHSEELDYRLTCVEESGLDGLVASRVQGFRGNLAEAVGLLSDTDVGGSEEAEAKIRLVLERKAYGEKGKNCVVSEDSSRLACWHWETASLAHFDKESQAKIRQARTLRSRTGRKVKAIKKLIQVLTTSPDDKVKVSREEEKVDKIKREERVEEIKKEQLAAKKEQMAAKKKEQLAAKTKPPPPPPSSEKKKKKETAVSSAQQNMMKMFTQQRKSTQSSTSTPTTTRETTKREEEEEMAPRGSLLDLDNLPPPPADVIGEVRSKRTTRRREETAAPTRYFVFHEREGLPALVIDENLESEVVTGRTPFAKDPSIDYDADSVLDEDELLGEEDEPADAESLNDDDDEDDEEDNLDYEDGFLLGDDEVDGAKVEQRGFSSSAQHDVIVASPTQNPDILQKYAAVVVTPLNPTDSWRPPPKPKRQRKTKSDGDATAKKKQRRESMLEPPPVVVAPAVDETKSGSPDLQRKLTTFFSANAAAAADVVLEEN